MVEFCSQAFLCVVVKSFILICFQNKRKISQIKRKFIVVKLDNVFMVEFSSQAFLCVVVKSFILICTLHKRKIAQIERKLIVV